jgi:predicted nucleic acid-binding protein
MARVYLDSCIVIHLLEGGKAVQEAVKRRLRPTQGSPPAPCISDLTRLECRVRPLREGKAELLAQYDAFFGLPEVAVLPMASAVYDLATELRARHALKTPDALHLATAITGGCEEIWTNDQRLAAAAAGRLRVVPLR